MQPGGQKRGGQKRDGGGRGRGRGRGRSNQQRGAGQIADGFVPVTGRGYRNHHNLVGRSPKPPQAQGQPAVQSVFASGPLASSNPVPPVSTQDESGEDLLARFRKCLKGGDTTAQAIYQQFQQNRDREKFEHDVRVFMASQISKPPPAGSVPEVLDQTLGVVGHGGLVAALPPERFGAMSQLAAESRGDGEIDAPGAVEHWESMVMSLVMSDIVDPVLEGTVGPPELGCSLGGAGEVNDGETEVLARLGDFLSGDSEGFGAFDKETAFGRWRSQSFAEHDSLLVVEHHNVVGGRGPVNTVEPRMPSGGDMLSLARTFNLHTIPGGTYFFSAGCGLAASSIGSPPGIGVTSTFPSQHRNSSQDMVASVMTLTPPSGIGAPNIPGSSAFATLLIYAHANSVHTSPGNLTGPQAMPNMHGMSPGYLFMPGPFDLIPPPGMAGRVPQGMQNVPPNPLLMNPGVSTGISAATSGAPSLAVPDFPSAPARTNPTMRGDVGGEGPGLQASGIANVPMGLQGDSLMHLYGNSRPAMVSVALYPSVCPNHLGVAFCRLRLVFTLCVVRSRS